MATHLIVAEHSNGKLAKATLASVTAAQKVGGDVHLGHARDLRRRLRDRIDAVPCDDGLDLAQLRRGGDSRIRRVA